MGKNNGCRCRTTKTVLVKFLQLRISQGRTWQKLFERGIITTAAAMTKVYHFVMALPVAMVDISNFPQFKSALATVCDQYLFCCWGRIMFHIEHLFRLLLWHTCLENQRSSLQLDFVSFCHLTLLPGFLTIEKILPAGNISSQQFLRSDKIYESCFIVGQKVGTCCVRIAYAPAHNLYWGLFFLYHRGS